MNACAGCQTFTALESLPEETPLCMYCRHDVTAHPMGERCTCTRQEVYPPDLLASLRLNQERHDADLAALSATTRSR